MLPELAVYERFIYSLLAYYPFIRQSTLVLIPHGPAFAEVNGVRLFDHDIRLTIWEDLDFEAHII